MSTVITSGDLDHQLNRAMGEKMRTAIVHARFVSPYVGGQPASREGVAAFVEHHLHLAGQAKDDAVNRILGEEVRIIEPADGTGETPGEVEEKESYGLNVIRHNADGCAYIGTWQVRAMIKQAASRLGLFKAKGKVGSKGDLSEGMLVAPCGASNAGGPQEICILNDGKPRTERAYEKFMGSVNTPKGRMSIVHDSEVAPVGSEIIFSVNWPAKLVTKDDMVAVIALGRRIGLGSVKALERGRFEVLKMEVGE